MAPQTRREVLVAREAFLAGVDFGVKNLYSSHTAPCETCARRAALLYPLPKVTRPRVFQFNGWEYKCERGAIYCRKDSGWMPGHSAPYIAGIADLLANPTEEVDAEE